MDLLNLLVARLVGQPLKGWTEAQIPAEPAEGLPAIDFDLLAKVTPEDGHSRDGQRRIGTPVTAYLYSSRPIWTSARSQSLRIN